MAMKQALLVMVTLLIATGYSNTNREYSRAMERLDCGKELYFSFNRTTDMDLNRMNSLVSLDKVEGSVVYAYANKAEFQKFLGENIPFLVETNPGDMQTFECSDYAEPGSYREFTKWPSYDGYLNILSQYASQLPEYVKVIDVGTSGKGHAIKCYIVSGNKSGKRKARVIQWGAIHGDELTGTMVSFKMTDLLIESYKANDERITTILDNLEIWTIPFCNLDGTYRAGNNSVNGAQRGNAAGVDLNRTFPACPGVNPGASEQSETRTLKSFMAKYQFTIGADFHGGTEAYLIPWCGKSAKHSEDAWYRTAVNQLKSNTNGGVSVGQAIEVVNYNAPGCIDDYFAYHHNLKSYTFEMSNTKLISESQFTTYWNKYKEMLLTFYEQAFTGIQGAVLDSISGEAIKDVKVSVGSSEKDNTWVFSYDDGGYYRLLSTGTYDVTFSHNEYRSTTIKAVSVENLKKTELNVKLYPLNTGIMNVPAATALRLSIHKNHEGITFGWSRGSAGAQAYIYNASGELVSSISTTTTQTREITWKGTISDIAKSASGCYIVDLRTNDGIRITERFMLAQ
ncbi:MAG: carboxypeptidase regulatory-like domain-containing protein [Chitinivibrionales bacterium]|nr:carboxypeptidase regulatory-like domain-containing protein [Chitinivibrionales bacterium]